MADLINLRCVKKAKARAEKSAQADANRAKHGAAKPVRELAKARREKNKKSIDAHKLDEN
jgi:hypothetical protein